jgi:endonuclease/exonuclease/phosphatase family metal-dependent hydrolase
MPLVGGAPLSTPEAAPQSAQPVAGGGPVDQAQLAAVLRSLVETVTRLVQALTQAQQGAGTLAPPSTMGGGMPAQPGSVQQGPVQQGPVQPTKQSGPVTQSGIKDGPGVYRDVMSKAELEKNPKLKGKLDPPPAGKPPKGVKVKTRADGTRALTINIHGGAPAGKSPTQGQDIRALRDVARYVNSVNPDVVMVQEMNDQKNSGIPHMPSVFAHLIGASDMAFTPGKGKTDDRKDTATYTRNGFKIDHAVNVDLPDNGDPARRSAGVMSVVPPDGGEAFTVMSTHLSHMPGVAASTRRKHQMQELARIAKSIEQTGSFTYHVPGMAKEQTATGFQSRIMLGGDLNTTQKGREAGIDAADQLLGAANLRNANDLYGRGNVKMGIDHIYAHGMDATSSAKVGVAAHELTGGQPTDHPGYITDLK